MNNKTETNFRTIFFKATVPGSQKSQKRFEDPNFQPTTDSDTVKRRTRTENWKTKTINKK